MINQLANKFQERFTVNFKLFGVLEITDYPICTMQVLDELHSDFKKTIGNKKFKNVKTTIQFNYSTKTPLEDLEFINRFTSYLKTDFKLDFHPDVEVVSMSSSRDLTQVNAGTTIYAKSIDVVFNRFVSYEPEVFDITAIEGNLNESNLIVEKEE